MLSMCATMSNEHGGSDINVIYIDTESAFSPQRWSIFAKQVTSLWFRLALSFIPYICRFREMAAARYASCHLEESNLDKAMSRVHVKRPNDSAGFDLMYVNVFFIYKYLKAKSLFKYTNGFWEFDFNSLSMTSSMKSLESDIINLKAGVVIIDSIASLIRKEFGTGDNLERTDHLSSQAALLKYLAESFSIPVSSLWIYLLFKVSDLIIIFLFIISPPFS